MKRMNEVLNNKVSVDDIVHYLWMLLGKCGETTHSRLGHKPPYIKFADLR